MSVAGLTLTWEHEPSRYDPAERSAWRLIWQEKQQVLARIFPQDGVGTFALHYVNSKPLIVQEYLNIEAAQAAGIAHAEALETP